ncbi:hypothetical protein VCRA2116O28_20404 [Vibrio crassostreae]|nr:hypothetical protein VCRA2116O26_10018 [Vibrio crassostreae]CAK1989500.1 hypothetical protein VCRA2117O38_20015 [Vibrio crassostreae]CAK2002357.1 hypothetical protein VCRA2119O46_20019 [Vibrio crassostreae]CAK2026302.1 hypothetical protein VCRA2113O22_20406 [Vibrio crassostreae]CAK2034220.1 hypothetical protein VCRA2116O28_20404 [Vibrio crassostreae]
MPLSLLFMPFGYVGRLTPTHAISCWQQGHTRIALVLIGTVNGGMR